MDEQMMSSFDLGMSVDDIEAPVLLPEGWYEFEIATPAPAVKPNQAKVNNPADEKAGDNWVINVTSVHEEAMFNGRRFTLWLSVPKPGDYNVFTNRGQRVSHAKADRIMNFTESFQGAMEDGPSGPRSTPVVNVGGRGLAFVQQKLDGQSGEVINQIDPFGKFKAIPSDIPG